MGILSGLSEVARVTGISKLVNPLVDGVLGQFTIIKQQWMDDIRAPFLEMVADVEAGGIWTGAGADLFVQECREKYIPAAEDVADKVARRLEGINDAQEIINEADKAAAQVAEGFAELAGIIF
jgi:hypothetical protein